MDQKFLDQAGGDPEKAAHLRSAYYRSLAAKSAQTRRKAKEARKEAAKVEREVGELTDDEKRTLAEIQARSDELALRFVDWDGADDAPRLRAMVNESVLRGMRQAAVGETVRRDDWLAPTLIDFLLDRIAEDARIYGGHQHGLRTELAARLLAECNAKRRIVQLCWTPDWVEGNDEVLLALAAPYGDHPDYQPEWA